MRGWRAWARPRGDSAARPLEKEGRREKNGEGSAWTLCSGLPSRRESNRTTNGHEWTRISSSHEAVSVILYIFVYFVCFVVPNLNGRARSSAPTTHYFLPSSLLPTFVVLGCLYWSVGETEIEDTT